MSSNRRNRNYGLVLGLSGLCLGAAGLHAQEGGGLAVTYGLDSRLVWHDNIDLNVVDPRKSLQSDTRLSFGIRSTTGTDSYIGLSGNALLREALSGRSDTREGLINPALRLAFGRATVGSGVEGGLFFSKTELSTKEDVEDFDSDSGNRRSFGGNLNAHWGADSRVTYRLGLSANNARFSSSANEDDRDTLRLNGGIGLDLTEILTLNLNASRYWFDEDGRADRVTDTLSTNLGIQQQNGSFGITYTITDTPEGTRNSLSFNRALELPSGTFDLRLGATRDISGDISGTGGLAYKQDLPNGAIVARLDHDISSSDSTDRETTVTRGSLSMSHDWSERSSISMDVSYAKQERGTIDTINTRAGISISYALGDDWQANAGLRYIERERSTGTATDNSIFIGLRKSFDRSY